MIGIILQIQLALQKTQAVINYGLCRYLYRYRLSINIIKERRNENDSSEC